MNYFRAAPHRIFKMFKGESLSDDCASLSMQVITLGGSVLQNYLGDVFHVTCGTHTSSRMSAMTTLVVLAVTGPAAANPCRVVMYQCNVLLLIKRETASRCTIVVIRPTETSCAITYGHSAPLRARSSLPSRGRRRLCAAEHRPGRPGDARAALARRCAHRWQPDRRALGASAGTFIAIAVLSPCHLSPRVARAPYTFSGIAANDLTSVCASPRTVMSHR